MPTVRIDDKRWRELEKKAVEVTIKTQKPCTVAEVIKSLIDKGLKEARPEEIKAKSP